MGTFWCGFGVHRWVRKSYPEFISSSGAATYLECERCQKRKGGDGGCGNGGGGGGWFGGGGDDGGGNGGNVGG